MKKKRGGANMRFAIFLIFFFKQLKFIYKIEKFYYNNSNSSFREVDFISFKAFI